jgi:hypothetical protein
VTAGCGFPIEGGFRQQKVSERLQQSLGDFLERAPEAQDAAPAILFCQGLMQAVVMQQLQEQMADLQQIIIGLGVIPVLAEDVLQVQAAVFLNVEAFVFDFDAQATDLVGNGDDGLPGDRQIGQPGKGCFFASGGSFLTEDGPQSPGAFLAVDVRQMLDPSINAARFVRQLGGEFLFGLKFQKGLKLLPQGGQAAFLKGHDAMPMVLLTDGKCAAASVEGVEVQTEPQLGEGGLEGGGQPVKGLEFAILFLFLIVGRGAAGRIFDELAGQRERQPRAGEQLGFEHRMEVGDLARGVFLGQALRAMAMAETEIAGAVNGGHNIALEPEIVQGFHADEPLSVFPEQVSESRAADMADKVVEGLGDGQSVLVGAGQKIEIVEDGAFQIAQVVIGRTPATQPQSEEQQSPPAQKAPVIFHQGLATSIGQLIQPGGQLREEVADGSDEGPGQGYDLPRRRRLAATWERIRARASWVI